MDESPSADACASDLDELLARVASGDSGAFEAFYCATAPRVFGVARAVLRDQDRAEEVAQEVFVEVWRKAADFDPTRGRATTWLLTMAHHRAIDRVRSVQAARDRDERELQLDPARPTDVVWDEVARGAEHADVRRAVENLTELQREAIGLTYFQGLTYRQAAERLDRPLGTIKTRIRDGLRALADRLMSDQPAA